MCRRRQRDLGGADQEQLGIGVRDGVDLLARLGEEARADERLLAHEHGRHDRREALADELVERVLRRSRRAAGRCRRAGRRSASPRRRAPRSMSIIPPARSRWSRGSKSNSGFGRLDDRVHRRVLLAHAVGGATRAAGSAAPAWPSRRSRRARAAPSSSAARRSRSSAAGRHLGGCVAPGALGLADRLRGGVALRAQLVDLASAGRAAARRARAPRRAGRPLPRRASAARTRSVSERMRRMSSMVAQPRAFRSCARSRERLEQLRDAVLVHRRDDAVGLAD